MTATAQLETTERSRSAYHEAGHFVVALALDSPALRVRALHIHESERHTGAVVTDSDGIFSWHDAREVCTILLAGFHAESRFSGTPMIEAATTDLMQAEELIRELSGSPHHWTTHALEISDRARRLVAMYWPAIDALARELLATSSLDERRARAIAARHPPSPPPRITRSPRNAAAIRARGAMPPSRRIGYALRMQRAASGRSDATSTASQGDPGS